MGIKFGQAQKDAEFYKAAYLHCEHSLKNAIKEIERLKGRVENECNENKGSGKLDDRCSAKKKSD